MLLNLSLEKCSLHEFIFIIHLFSTPKTRLNSHENQPLKTRMMKKYIQQITTNLLCHGRMKVLSNVLHVSVKSQTKAHV